MNINKLTFICDCGWKGGIKDAMRDHYCPDPDVPVKYFCPKCMRIIADSKGNRFCEVEG